MLNKWKVRGIIKSCQQFTGNTNKKMAKVIIKTTLKNYFSSTRLQKFKTPCLWSCEEISTFLHCWWELKWAIMEGNLTIPIKITHVILFDTISKLLESPPMDALTCVKIRCVCVYMYGRCVCVYICMQAWHTIYTYTITHSSERKRFQKNVFVHHKGIVCSCSREKVNIHMQ